MNAGFTPSADDFSQLASELEALVALHEQRGGIVFPVEWASKHHAPPYRTYVTALHVAARASDRERLADALRVASRAGEDQAAALQRYLLGQTIQTSGE